MWPQSVFEKSDWTIFLVVGLGAHLHEPEDALVEAVTHEDIIRVGRRVLDPQRVVVAVIKPG